VRRLPVAVLLLAVALACGSVFAAPVAAATRSLSGVTVSTDVAAKPTIEFDEPFAVKKPADDVVVVGTGEKLAKGQNVTFDFVLVDGRTGEEVQTSWGGTPASLSLDAAKTAKSLVNGLKGTTVGSRVLIAVAPKEGLAGRLAQQGVKKNDSLLFVIDVKSATTPLTRAAGEAVAPVDGLPTVDLAKNGKPSVTVPKGTSAPTDLVVQPLITGTGPVVQTGQTISVHYTGIIWDTGKKFDSSWDRGTPAEFAIGTGNVIAGWDEGLVGQTVGSQVLLVVPPDKGYGATGQSSAGIKGTDTLVFVVDILAAS
jgi:peptidylprolyl isomerase